MEIAEVQTFTKILYDYGYPLALSALLLWYTFKNQREINKSAQVREEEYRKVINVLKDNIYNTACESNGRIKDMSDDVETLDVKVVKIDGKVDVINGKMDNAIAKLDQSIYKLDTVHKKIHAE